MKDNVALTILDGEQINSGLMYYYIYTIYAIQRYYKKALSYTVFVVKKHSCMLAWQEWTFWSLLSMNK